MNTFDPELYGEALRLDLEDGRGRRYSVSLAYDDPDHMIWEYPYRGRRPGYPRRFPGFEAIMDLDSFSVLESTGEDNVLLVVLHTFAADFVQDVDEFAARATERKLLQHDIVVDATHTDGGHDSPHLLRRLASRPLESTSFNLRISDITSEFIDWMRNNPDHIPRLLAWLETEVTKAALEGREYISAVPYHQMRYGVDDITHDLMPIPEPFEGNLVFLFGSMSGSQVDQLASMVIDNGLGHTIGMPTGGYSNFWHWRETIVFPSTKRPIAGFEWSIGQTIRPNGQPLEGNPPMVDDYVPFDRGNYARYYDLLLERAVRYLRDRRELPDVEGNWNRLETIRQARWQSPARTQSGTKSPSP